MKENYLLMALPQNCLSELVLYCKYFTFAFSSEGHNIRV